MTRKSIKEDADIKKSAKEFVAGILAYAANHGAYSIFNSDQSGFNRELQPARTLDHKGIFALDILISYFENAKTIYHS